MRRIVKTPVPPPFSVFSASCAAILVAIFSFGILLRPDLAALYALVSGAVAVKTHYGSDRDRSPGGAVTQFCPATALL